jgi:hypothetical protein
MSDNCAETLDEIRSPGFFKSPRYRRASSPEMTEILRKF